MASDGQSHESGNSSAEAVEERGTPELTQLMEIMTSLLSEAPLHSRLANGSHSRETVIAGIREMVSQIVEEMQLEKLGAEDEWALEDRDTWLKWNQINLRPQMLDGLEMKMLSIFLVDAVWDFRKYAGGMPSMTGAGGGQFRKE